LYYDTATVIVSLILVGRYLEARARARTSDEMRALAALGAKTAHVRRPGGMEEDVPVERLAVGDVVIVRPAAPIASDGRVLAGSPRSSCRSSSFWRSEAARSGSSSGHSRRSDLPSPRSSRC